MTNRWWLFLSSETRRDVCRVRVWDNDVEQERRENIRLITTKAADLSVSRTNFVCINFSNPIFIAASHSPRVRFLSRIFFCWAGGREIFTWVSLGTHTRRFCVHSACVAGSLKLLLSTLRYFSSGSLRSLKSSDIFDYFTFSLFAARKTVLSIKIRVCIMRNPLHGAFLDDEEKKLNCSLRPFFRLSLCLWKKPKNVKFIIDEILSNPYNLSLNLNHFN